jgi:hypothetical protein
MSLREEQCKKVCRILDDVLANRPTERDSLIVATRKAFKALAEPKRGKWESQSDGGCCCSLCGRYAMDKADGRIVMISVKSRFCPNCGAKMEVTT